MPLLNLKSQDPKGGWSVIEYTFKKGNHLASKTGLIYCDLREKKKESETTHTITIKFGFSIQLKCQDIISIIGFYSSDNLVTKQRFLKAAMMKSSHKVVASGEDSDKPF